MENKKEKVEQKTKKASNKESKKEIVSKKAIEKNITVFANETTIERKWFVIDAKDIPIGRLATQVAILLRGKHKAMYTPNVDVGDFVIIINSDKVKLTGKKLDQKKHRWHTQYPGGLKEESYKTFLTRKSDEAIRLAIKGMLPKGPLGRKQLSKLKIFKNSEHNHEAQKPEVFRLQKIN